MIVAGRLILDARHPPAAGWLRIEGDRIAEIGAGDPPGTPSAGGDACLISPGFIDAHIHLPQIDSIGRDGLPLLQWLDSVIYPAESRWQDAPVARRQIIAAYSRMIRAGTLGYAGYLSPHAHSVEEALRVAQRVPLRAIAGQVLMDRSAPEWLLNQPLARLARSAKGRLDASLNPRFAVACSEELLLETGRRLREGFPHSAKRRIEGDMGLHLFVQTHLAETREECERVRELFPNHPTYTALYDACGLLGPHTLLAHCLHLSDDEWRLIAERGSVVVHCPAANTFLESGLFDLTRAFAHGVRLALGSDVAAGPDVAMPRVARAMIEVAKARRMTSEAPPPAEKRDPALASRREGVPSPAEAWTMITRGNADALGWHDAGRLEVGAAADLLIIRPPFEIDEHIIGRLLYEWDDAFIALRIIAGRALEGKAHPAAP